MADKPRPYGESAFKYKLAGWAGPLPVKGKAPGKSTVGFTGNAGRWPNDDDVAEWVRTVDRHNIALRLPENVIGLDVDAWKGDDAEAVMVDLSESHGKLPRTWLTTSRDDKSGIRLYRLPEGIDQSDLAGNIELGDRSAGEIVRFGHRVAVVWPSIHPDTGETYRWVHQGTGESRIPRPAELPHLPTEWAAHLLKDCSHYAAANLWVRFKESRDPVRDCFDKWDDRITSGSYSRHDAALGGAMGLVAFQNWPQADQYLQKIEDAFLAAVTADKSRTEREARAEWQRMVDGARAKVQPIPYEPPSRNNRAAVPSVVPQGGTLSELMGREIEPIRFVVDGLIPEGLTILAGKPKLGKSWLALLAALAVCAGDDVLDHSTGAAETLYVALEDGERRLQDRVRILDGHKIGKALRRFHYRTTWPAFTGDGIATLEQWMVDHPDTRLIVVDTFGKARGPLAGKDKYQEEYDLAGRLQTFAVSHRVAVVIVHHIRKQGADDWLESISGSQAITGAADAILGLFRERGQMDATLRLVSRDLDEKDLALRFDSGRWESMGDAGAYRLTVERSAILEALDELGGEGKVSDVAAMVDKSPANTSKLLAKLAAEGHVRKARYGVYALGQVVDPVEVQEPTSTTSTTSTRSVDQGSDLEVSAACHTCDRPGDLITERAVTFHDTARCRPWPKPSEPTAERIAGL